MTCGAIIPAAGQASRFGPEDKTLVRIAGQPVLEWTLRALINANVLSQVVVVVSDANQFPVIDLISRIESAVPIGTVRGGALRMESVRAGVRALDESCELVLIHDAARPAVSPELAATAVNAATEHGAVIPGTPVTDTIKRVEHDVVVGTIDRRELIAVQTPQVFRRDWLIAAYDTFPPDIEATDEAAILEAAGYAVHVIPGDPANIKVTTATDALVAEAILHRNGSS